MTVRVLNLAQADHASLMSALNVTNAVYRATGIAVRWKFCAEPTVCTAELGPTEVWLRVAPGRPREHAGLSADALGYSVVGSKRSSLSTVFVGSVEHLARKANVATAELLGVVVAHELAHLILNSPHHTESGLMRHGWSAAELGRTPPADLRFSRQEGFALGAGLARLTSDGGFAPERSLVSPAGMVETPRLQAKRGAW